MNRLHINPFDPTLRKPFFRLSLMIFLIVVCVLIGVVQVSQTAAAGTYYIAPEPIGKATNNGLSANSPWTLTKAFGHNVTPANSTIIFLPGTYRVTTSIYQYQTFTLQAETGAEVWIKGSIVIPDNEWVVNGDDWVRNGWTYQFPRPSNDNPLNVVSQYPLANNGDMVYVNGTSMVQVGSPNAVVPGTFYVDYVGDKLYLGTNPMGKMVESTVKTFPFDVAFNNTVVRGLRFAHFAEHGLRIGAANVLIENNIFTLNGRTGLFLLGTFGSAVGSASRDLIARGNTFSWNGQNGMGGNEALRLLVENNSFYNNNSERFNFEYAAAGIKMTRTDNAIIRNNRILNNYASGIWMDIGSDNVTVVGNTIQNNNYNGMWFEVSHDANIVGNLFLNNINNLTIQTSANARIYNNTIVGGKTSLNIYHQYNRGIIAGSDATYRTQNTTIVNNIFSNPSGNDYSKSMIETDTGDPASCTAVIPMVSVYDYNFYERSNPIAPYFIHWVRADKCDQQTSSLPEFRTLSGFEQHGIDDGRNPVLFVNAAGADYRLKPGSKAIGTGKPLPADIAALLGVAANVCVDMGRYQSNSGCVGAASSSPSATLDTLTVTATLPTGGLTTTPALTFTATIATATPVMPTLTFTPVVPTATPITPTLTFTPIVPTTTPLAPTLTYTATIPTATPITPTITYTPTVPSATGVPATATIPPPTGPTLSVVVSPATAKVGDIVQVTLNLSDISGLYGLETTCAVDASVLTGSRRLDGVIFNNSNSFFVDAGYRADGTWRSAASLLAPAPVFSGSGSAFTWEYQVISTGSTPVNCTVMAVDINGRILPIQVVSGAYTGEGQPPLMSAGINNSAQPEILLPTQTATVEPVVAAKAESIFGAISGIAAYQNRPDNAGIQVQLLAGGVVVADLVTGANGAYSFDNIPVGDYQVILSAVGHLSVQYDSISVSEGQIVDLDVGTLPGGDSDSSGLLDLSDAALVGANFSVSIPPAPSNADLNGDGVINITDLTLVGSNFGRTGPISQP